MVADDAPPMLNVVAAPPMLRVVAVELNSVAEAELVVMSPPFTARSPVTTVLALLIVAVPVAAPMDSVVAAPPRFTVVAVVLKRF